MKLKPLGDKIIVKRVDALEKTRGGIILPDTAKEKPQEGIVIEVGDGRLVDNGERIRPTVKKGDKVIFASYAGTEVKADGEEFLIMPESEVFAVIDRK